MQSVNDFFRGRAGQRSNAVIGLHPAERDVVSGIANCIDRKFVVLDLGFLQAHDVGFVRGDPVENNRQATADGVYVIGGDLHRDGCLIIARIGGRPKVPPSPFGLWRRGANFPV
jgi:hypothetical protein